MSSPLTREYAEKISQSLEKRNLNNRKRDSEDYQSFVSDGFQFNFGFERNVLQLCGFGWPYAPLSWGAAPKTASKKFGKNRCASPAGLSVLFFALGFSCWPQLNERLEEATLELDV